MDASWLCLCFCCVRVYQKFDALLDNIWRAFTLDSLWEATGFSIILRVSHCRAPSTYNEENFLSFNCMMNCSRRFLLDTVITYFTGPLISIFCYLFFDIAIFLLNPQLYNFRISFCLAAVLLSRRRGVKISWMRSPCHSVRYIVDFFSLCGSP